MNKQKNIEYSLGFRGGCIDPYAAMWTQQWPSDVLEAAMDIVGGYGHKEVLSAYNGQLIGYGLFSPMTTPANSEYVLPLIEQEITAVRGDSESILWLEEYLEIIQDVSGGEKNIDYFNDFRLPIESDFYFGANLVLPEYRGQGIGSQLFDRRLELAAERGATGVFSHCSSSISLLLCESRGFTKIIRKTPGYYDGSTSTLVAKEFDE